MMISKYLSFLPHAVFTLFTLRLIALGASIGDAIALISMVAIYGFVQWLDSKKVSQYEELKEEIEHVRNGVQAVRVAQGIKTRNTNEQTQKDGNKRYF